MACGVTWFHAASNMDGLTCASHAPRLSSVPRASLGQWMLRPQIPCRPSQDAVVRRPLAHEACLSLFAGNRMSLTRSGQLSTGRNRFSDIQSRYYVHAARDERFHPLEDRSTATLLSRVWRRGRRE